MPIDSHTSDGPDDLHWEALARFHAGESAPGEAERMREQLASDPSGQAFLALLSRGQEDDALSAGSVDVEAALVAVRRRLIAVDEPVRPSLSVALGGRGAVEAKPAPVRRWTGVLFGIAAMFVAAVAIGQWQSRTDSAGLSFESARTVVTAPMQHDSLVLADGTQVRLAPGTRLTIDSAFNGTHRTVQLDGTAHFTVSHAGKYPFIVRTAVGEVRDIGTAFAVKTGVDGYTTVAVTEGQVRVTRAGDSASVDLFAGDRAEMAVQGASKVTRNAVSADDMAWTTNRLVYNEATVSDVLADLERWYGVALQADSTVAMATLQGELLADSLPKVLRVVGLAVGAEVESRNGGYYLRAREGKPPR